MSKSTIELSIIIATFNSEHILPKVLDSIKKQTFPQNKLQILLIDGGSTDGTFKIAEKYKCIVINNPKTDPVNAKFLGYTQAQGTYLLYLDHDEVIENPRSLEKKIQVFKENENVRAVIGSGYKNPKGYPFINNYINEFGDPFSAYIYNLSKDARFFLKQMIKRYGFIANKKDYTIFNLTNVQQMPIIELVAGGSMFDGNYMKKHFTETKNDIRLIPHFFYLMNSKGADIALTKNDALFHYSSDTLGKYLNKIRWRVKNNIYHVSEMGASGFTGREQYSSNALQYKKYLFIPYVFTLIVCFFDAIKLCVTRKDIRYLIHVPLCIFTASLIIYHTVMHAFGYKPDLRSYDESKSISTEK